MTFSRRAENPATTGASLSRQTAGEQGFKKSRRRKQLPTLVSPVHRESNPLLSDGG